MRSKNHLYYPLTNPNVNPNLYLKFKNVQENFYYCCNAHSKSYNSFIKTIKIE